MSKTKRIVSIIILTLITLFIVGLIIDWKVTLKIYSAMLFSVLAVWLLLSTEAPDDNYYKRK